MNEIAQMVARQGRRRRNSRSYCNDERRGNAAGKARSPDLQKSLVGLAARRADRRVMLLVNTSSIPFVAFLALGPSAPKEVPLGDGGQRKPVISVNRP